MSTSAEFQALLLNLWGDLRSVKILWQVGVLTICIGIGWALARSYNRRIDGRHPDAAAQALGIGGIQRLLFPVSTLILVLIAKAVLRHWQNTQLLNVAIALLLALALIRLAIYVLRHTFAPSAWLRASERWISWLAWGGVAIYLTGLWPPLRDGLNDLSFTVGTQKFTLLLILQGTLSVILAVLLALWLGRLAETRLMRATSLQINLRVMFAKLIQILLLLTVVLIALPAVGIDLTVLSVFGGMLGVGIGFGLQNIVNNFVSGLILAFERPVREGDQITLGTTTGRVDMIGLRATRIRTFDGAEVIVPNANLISSEVTNWTLSDRARRIDVTVGVDYDSDPVRVREILLEAVRDMPRLAASPAPVTVFRGFGASSLDFSLLLWTHDVNDRLDVESEARIRVFAALRAAGIQIPFPRMDVQVRERGGEPGPVPPDAPSAPPA